ncbi:hypothetical protein [Paraburkholderia sp. BR14320]|uniref:hypothetical protein n=1 Tax=unclassified Paraburkholderia TaxID=2615204 RepID=UPI0034CDE258
MKLISTAVVAALSMVPLVPGAAEAACHFNTNNAIVCESPESAAYAYLAFGKDRAKTDIDYNRQLMRQAYCGRPFGDRYASVMVEQIDSGRVATPRGWVEVVRVVTEANDIYIVAKPYLTGVCEPWTHTRQPPSAPLRLDAPVGEDKMYGATP